MNIKNKVRYLEDKAGASCSECKNTPLSTHPYYPDKGETRPEPPQCSKCGRFLGVILRMEYEDCHCTGCSGRRQEENRERARKLDFPK